MEGLAYLQSYRDRHGRERCYYRHGSYRVPLPSPREPGFKAAYQAAKASDPLPQSLKAAADARVFTPCHVYAIECAGYVKIGYAINVHKRLAGINTSAPVLAVLLGSVECPETDTARRVEAELHAKFEPYRTNGEWFQISPETALAAIKEVENEFNRTPA